MLAQDASLTDETLAYWRRAVAVNPWAPDYRANLATVLAHTVSPQYSGMRTARRTE